MTNRIWAKARIALGLVFLWAFVDKVFGLGFATKSDMSWLDGVSPTTGFLGKATTGPLADFYHNLAGSAWVDWVFMLALLFLGLALVFGVCLHLAGWGGALLMVAMWSALWPVENNPLIDEHIIYALMLAGFGSTDVGDAWSFRARWRATGLVQRHPVLA